MKRILNRTYRYLLVVQENKYDTTNFIEVNLQEIELNLEGYIKRISECITMKSSSTVVYHLNFGKLHYPLDQNLQPLAKQGG